MVEMRNQNQKNNFPGTYREQCMELNSVKTGKVTLEVIVIVAGQNKDESAVVPDVCTPRRSSHCQDFI
jgi:hypothetical protein